MADFVTVGGQTIDLDLVERFRPWSLEVDYKARSNRGGYQAAEMTTRMATLAQNRDTTWVTFQGGREMQLRIAHEKFQKLLNERAGRTTTMDDIKRSVANALLRLIDEDEKDELDAITVALVTERVGGDLYLVGEAIAQLGLEIDPTGEVYWREPDTRRDLKLFLHTKAAQPTVSTIHNTVNNHGNNIQAAAGGNVTGTMNITITYEQVLQQLVQDVEASNLPAEKKSSVVAAVKALLKEGVLQGVKVSAGDLVKLVYAHSGGISAVAEQFGRVL